MPSASPTPAPSRGRGGTFRGENGAGVRPFELEVLAAAVGVELGVNGGQRRVGEPAGGLELLAELLGVSYSTAQRMRRHGLSEVQADRAAIAVGLLPELVWPAYGEQLRAARLQGAAAVNAAKAACPLGHAYDTVDSRGWRRCNRCRLSPAVASRRTLSHRAHSPQEDPVSEKLLTAREVARRWQVSRRTVERRVAAGELAATKVGGATRFRLEDVEAYELATQR
jgi:excisionase family DNA binding protein